MKNLKIKLLFALSALLLLSAFTTGQKDVITIFMIGDSTMANKSLKNGNLERGWGQMLPGFLTDDVKVDNHAMNGRSSLSFINEGRWDAVLAKLKKGDYVFIQFGHNDEKPSEKLHTDPGSTFDDNLRRFVRETREKGAHPVLFNSIVRRNFPPVGATEIKGSYEVEGDVLVDTHGEYLNSPRTVAQEMNVPFVDLNKLTHDLVTGLGVEKSKELFMWVPAGIYDFCPKGKIDNTHLNIYGGKVVAGIAIEAVAEVVPELAPYVRHQDPEVYVADYKGDKKCALSYTFDDGLQEHYTLVFPEMEKVGFKGTFWVCGKIIEDEAAQQGKPRMTWAQMKEMDTKGHEISNHGWSHANLKRISLDEVRVEVEKNDSIILKMIGKKPVTFCYPFNAVNEDILQITSANRVGTRTKQYGVGGDKSKSTAESLDKWVNELMIAGDWGVEMIHGITVGYDAFASADILWEHFKRVKAQEEDIWVGTFREVAAYVKERRNVQLDVKKEKSSLTITPRLALNRELFDEPLTMVVKTAESEKVNVWQAGKKLPVRSLGDRVVFDFNPYGGAIKVSFGACTTQHSERIINNGIPWFDDRGNIVNAHGACIVEDGGRYYLFGEWKSDESNAFPGFSCYSSDDLVNWKFERVVLPVQPGGILGPNRVGERVKVMKCPSTGEYVMYMHADDMGYKDPYIGYATCSTINGEYQMQGPLLFEGQPIKRWDMGTFQDADGEGYLLIHHGDIYRLSEDYRSAEAKVAHVKGSGESPAMFKKNGMYYMLYSNLTSWEKNDNFYFTAPAVEGPWTKQGLFCPEGTLTYNSQSTFVFPLKRGNDTIPMFMGDRWSFPRQASAATYVWMPIQVDGTKISIPEYWQSWDIDSMQPVDVLSKGSAVPVSEMVLAPEWKEAKGRLSSNVKGSTLNVPFKGTHAAIIGESNPHSGYARVSVLNAEKDTVYSSLVDFYSKYPEKAVRIITPKMAEGDYTLSIEVTGIVPVWTDKSKTIFGSDNSFVTVDDIYYF